MQPIRSSRACFLGLIGWYHLELPEQVITMEPCSRNNLHLQFCGRSNFALWGGVAEPRRTRQRPLSRGDTCLTENQKTLCRRFLPGSS